MHRLTTKKFNEILDRLMDYCDPGFSMYIKNQLFVKNTKRKKKTTFNKNLHMALSMFVCKVLQMGNIDDIYFTFSTDHIGFLRDFDTTWLRNERKNKKNKDKKLIRTSLIPILVNMGVLIPNGFFKKGVTKQIYYLSTMAKNIIRLNFSKNDLCKKPVSPHNKILCGILGINPRKLDKQKKEINMNHLQSLSTTEHKAVAMIREEFGEYSGIIKKLSGIDINTHSILKSYKIFNDKRRSDPQFEAKVYTFDQMVDGEHIDEELQSNYSKLRKYLYHLKFCYQYIYAKDSLTSATYTFSRTNNRIFYAFTQTPRLVRKILKHASNKPLYELDIKNSNFQIASLLSGDKILHDLITSDNDFYNFQLENCEGLTRDDMKIESVKALVNEFVSSQDLKEEYTGDNKIKKIISTWKKLFPKFFRFIRRKRSQFKSIWNRDKDKLIKKYETMRKYISSRMANYFTKMESGIMEKAWKLTVEKFGTDIKLGTLHDAVYSDSVEVLEYYQLMLKNNKEMPILSKIKEYN